MAAGTVIGSFFASLVLFVPPVTLFGMVSPFAIRLGITDLSTAGAVAGRVFALSTAGSLLGTFLPSLVTIPLIGTQRTMIGAAALIALSAAFLLGARWLVIGVALAGLMALPPGVVKAETGLIYESESRYQFIQVLEQGTQRRLQLNEGYAVHSLYRPDTVLTGGEWDMFLAVPPLAGPAGGARGHARECRRHNSARVRRVLPAGGHRRRGDRPGRLRSGPTLLRHDREPAPHHPRPGRPPVPGRFGGILGPHLRRRLSPALRPLLSGHPRVLPHGSRAPAPGGHDRPQRLHGPGG